MHLNVFTALVRMLRLPCTVIAAIQAATTMAGPSGRIHRVGPRRERHTMVEITLPETVHRFVDTTNSHDADALFGVFAPGATVVDDGTTYNTEAAVREWIMVHQINPKIVITPVSFRENRLVGSANGNFPGGPLTFAFDFTVHDDAITNLVIGPA